MFYPFVQLFPPLRANHSDLENAKFASETAILKRRVQGERDTYANCESATLWSEGQTRQKYRKEGLQSMWIGNGSGEEEGQRKVGRQAGRQAGKREKGKGTKGGPVEGNRVDPLLRATNCVQLRCCRTKMEKKNKTNGRQTRSVETKQRRRGRTCEPTTFSDWPSLSLSFNAIPHAKNQERAKRGKEGRKKGKGSSNCIAVVVANVLLRGGRELREWRTTRTASERAQWDGGCIHPLDSLCLLSNNIGPGDLNSRQTTQKKNTYIPPHPFTHNRQRMKCKAKREGEGECGYIQRSTTNDDILHCPSIHHYWKSKNKYKERKKSKVSKRTHRSRPFYIMVNIPRRKQYILLSIITIITS